MIQSLEKTKKKEHPNLSVQSLGNYVKLRRKQLGLKQGELAELLNVDQSQISRLELGIQITSAEGLAEIAKALKIEPGILLNVLADYKPENQETITGHIIELDEDFTPDEIDDVKRYISRIAKSRVVDSVIMSDTNNNGKKSEKEKLEDARRKLKEMQAEQRRQQQEAKNNKQEQSNK